MLHNLWTLISISLIFFIILHNPKSQGLATQSQIFGATRTAEENINKITWILTFIFFTLTIIISSSDKMTQKNMNPSQICPVPYNQRPLNEYKNLKEAFNFKWIFDESSTFFKHIIKLLLVNYLLSYGVDRKSTRLNSSHSSVSRMPSSA